MNGRFQSSIGTSFCIDCAVGHYSVDPTPSSVHTHNRYCRRCGVGRYIAATQRSVCTLCEVGKQQEATGSTSCKNCHYGL